MKGNGRKNTMKGKTFKIAIIALKLIMLITPVIANLIFSDPVKEIAFDMAVEVAGAGSISVVMGSSFSKEFLSLFKELL